jgi:hypothetical protein
VLAQLDAAPFARAVRADGGALTALTTTIIRQNRMQISSVNLNLYDDRVER